jgi:glyoxylase-like metal-dependent hydrolase (beta-lactamase superfamily II)
MLNTAELTPLFKVVSAIMPTPAVVKTTDPFTGTASISLDAQHAVRTFPAPGHTPGSTVYLYEGVLFVGDIMNFDGHVIKGPVVDPNSEDNKRAVRALGPMLKDVPFDRICTGHGGCTPPGEAKKLLANRIAALGA